MRWLLFFWAFDARESRLSSLPPQPFSLYFPRRRPQLSRRYLVGVACLRSLVTLSVNQATHGSRTTSKKGIATHFGLKGGLPLLPLGMVFGGLSILLYGGRSFMFSAERALQKVDLQSAFFALVFVIVLLVLGAFLT